MERIFISSVQSKLAADRQTLKEHIQGDALLCRFATANPRFYIKFDVAATWTSR